MKTIHKNLCISLIYIHTISLNLSFDTQIYGVFKDKPDMIWNCVGYWVYAIRSFLKDLFAKSLHQELKHSICVTFWVGNCFSLIQY